MTEKVRSDSWKAYERSLNRRFRESLGPIAREFFGDLKDNTPSATGLFDRKYLGEFPFTKLGGAGSLQKLMPWARKIIKCDIFEKGQDSLKGRAGRSYPISGFAGMVLFIALILNAASVTDDHVRDKVYGKFIAIKKRLADLEHLVSQNGGPTGEKVITEVDRWQTRAIDKLRAPRFQTKGLVAALAGIFSRYTPGASDNEIAGWTIKILEIMERRISPSRAAKLVRAKRQEVELMGLLQPS